MQWTTKTHHQTIFASPLDGESRAASSPLPAPLDTPPTEPAQRYISMTSISYNPVSSSAAIELSPPPPLSNVTPPTPPTAPRLAEPEPSLTNTSHAFPRAVDFSPGRDVDNKSHHLVASITNIPMPEALSSFATTASNPELRPADVPSAPTTISAVDRTAVVAAALEAALDEISGLTRERY